MGGTLLHPSWGVVGIPFGRRAVVEAACPREQLPVVGDTEHLLVLVCLWLEFPWKPLLQETQAHESFSTIIIFKNLAPCFLAHIQISVSMETGIETASRRGSQIWLFPMVVCLGQGGWAGRPRGVGDPTLGLGSWVDAVSTTLGGWGLRGKPLIFGDSSAWSRDGLSLWKGRPERGEKNC